MVFFPLSSKSNVYFTPTAYLGGADTLHSHNAKGY